MFGKEIVFDQNYANDKLCGEMKKYSLNTREPGYGGTCTCTSELFEAFCDVNKGNHNVTYFLGRLSWYHNLPSKLLSPHDFEVLNFVQPGSY